MSPHAFLTESSLRAHPRKGREGKGIRKGVLTHPSSSVTGPRANAPSMDGGYAAESGGGR